MEAVAAAASVAGLATLLFQSIDGLIKFKELFAEASAASKTINGLNADVNSLIQTLEDVRGVLDKMGAQEDEFNFASLDLKLTDCSRDIAVWLSTAKLLRPTGEHGGKAWLKKFRFAVNKNAVESMRHEISRHRKIINLSLSVLGRNIDIENFEQISRMRTSVSSSLSNLDDHNATLQRIETMSKTSLQNSAQSISSMESLRSELSRLESMILQSKSLKANLSTQHGRVREPDLDSAAGSLSSDTPTGSHVSAARAGALIKGKDPADLASDSRSVTAKRRSVEVQGFNSTRLRNPGITKDVRSSTTYLYASYTTSDASALPPEADIDEAEGVDLDCMETYRQMRESMGVAYPSTVTRLIELHQMLELFRKQEIFLDALSDSWNGPDIVGTTTTAHSELLRRQIKGLQHACSVAESKCLSEGFPITKFRQVLANTYE